MRAPRFAAAQSRASPYRRANTDTLLSRPDLPFGTVHALRGKSKVAVQKAIDEDQLMFDSLMHLYFG